MLKAALIGFGGKNPKESAARTILLIEHLGKSADSEGAPIPFKP